MMTITFDTLAFTEELIASGVPEQQAKAHAKVHTKTLSSALEKTLSSALEARDIAAKKENSTLQQGMMAMEERLRREIVESKVEILKSQKVEILQSQVEMLKWVVGLLLAQTGLIIAAIKLIP